MRESHDFPPGTAVSAAFTEAGLVLGMGSRLVRIAEDGLGQDRLSIGIDHERALALLSIVARRSIGAESFTHLERAASHWHRGDKALANLRLIFADLPRLEEPSDVYRLCLAEHLLDEGMQPGDLMKELGLDALEFAKYSPDQARVPAGSGRKSGQWVRALGAAATFLADASPAIVARLTVLASRFFTPTAILGALFIPTPNSGGVTDGTLPEAPDISFRKDGPAGMLWLKTRADDGSEIVIAAQARRGVYFDIRTDKPIGRDLGDQLYLDCGAVDNAIDRECQRSAQTRPEPQSSVDDDEPKLCPMPTPDVEHGEQGKDYEDVVHARVNPIAPIPRGFGVNLLDPETGRPVYMDDCFRYAGYLVDGDMKAGDLVEAKGQVEFLLRFFVPNDEMAKEVQQAKKELRVADARGVGLKWYFAEEGAAEIMRQRFGLDKDLKRIVISHLYWRPRK